MEPSGSARRCDARLRSFNIAPAGNRPAGAMLATNTSTRLRCRPDFLAGGQVMRQRIVWVAELIRPERAGIRARAVATPL